MQILVSSKSGLAANQIRNVLAETPLADAEVRPFNGKTEDLPPRGAEAAVVIDWEEQESAGAMLVESILRRAPYLPVLLLCPHSKQPAANAGIQAGAMGFIDKPINGAALEKILRAAIRQKKKAFTFEYRIRRVPEREAGVLSAHGPYEENFGARFRDLFDELLAIQQPRIVVDLSKVDQLPDTIFESLNETAAWAEEVERAMAVVLSPADAKRFRDAGPHPHIRIAGD